MKWIIGLDTIPGHEGPAQLAAHVQELGFSRRGGEIVGIHVMPRADLVDAPVTPAERATLHDHERDSVEALLDRAGARGALVDTRVVEADRVHAELATFALEVGADAIVVGRRARRGDEPWVRLGPVARRLLRSLPMTVIVTPPEPGRPGGGAGPVMLAADLEQHTEHAAAVAVALAEALARPLVVVHVAPLVSFARGPLGGRFDATVQAIERDHAERVRAWAHDHHLSAAVATLSGEPVREIAAAAAAHDAAMVVVGSRRLSAAARIFEPSLATELAASSWVPVAVVPGA